jgi:hypothetical protein
MVLQLLLRKIPDVGEACRWEKTPSSISMAFNKKNQKHIFPSLPQSEVHIAPQVFEQKLPKHHRVPFSNARAVACLRPRRARLKKRKARAFFWNHA